MKVCLRLGVVGFMVLSLWQPAEAARITVGEIGGDGGGTIVNDGSNDVSSSNGKATADGPLGLMSSLGLTDSTLTADLAKLEFVASIERADPELGTATSANLRVLRLLGTVSTACADALECGAVTDADLGGSGLRGAGGAASEANVVLFSVDLVGLARADDAPLWRGPTGEAPSVVQLPTALAPYTLSEEQIAFIAGRMSAGGYNVGDVKIGLGISANGIGSEVTSTLEVAPIKPTPTPEPGTLTLLAAGIAMAGVRRLKKSAGH